MQKVVLAWFRLKFIGRHEGKLLTINLESMAPPSREGNRKRSVVRGITFLHQVHIPSGS